MLSLLIVEDEDILRTGLSTYIDWAELGYTITGLAENGQQAIDFLSKKNVDVVITDIKMPAVNGLELSRWIKQNKPETEIVIMSGYDEFDFAKEAIRISVQEYLLKPLNLNELYDTMKRISGVVEAKRQQKREYSQLLEMQSQALKQQQEKVLHQLVMNRESVQELETKHRDIWGLVKNDVYYVTLICLADPIRNINEYDYLELLAADTSLDHLMSLFTVDGRIVVIKENLCERIMLCRAQSSEDVIEISSWAKEKLLQQQGGTSCELFGGGSTRGVSGLSAGYQTAKAKWDNSIMKGWSMQPLPQTAQQEAFPTMFRYDSTLLISTIRSGDIKGVQAALETFSAELEKQNIFSYLQWLLIFSNLFNDVISLPAEIGCSSKEVIGNSDERLNDMMRLKKRGDILQAFADVCVSIAQLYAQTGKGRQLNILSQALEYINDHFSQPDLMLHDVAKSVYISESYLSMILKKEIGKTFTEVLTQVRMEQAKKLLCSTDLKNYEVALRCGYSNPSYFSTVFKGYFDCSPSRLKAKSSDETV